MCLSKGNAKPPRGKAIVSACEQEAATLDQLCTVEATHLRNGPRSITLDHHLYNNLSDRWTRQASRPQPYIRLTLSVKADDYADLGFELQANTKPLTSSVMADTGCQSCLAGIQVIQHLGLTRAALIPVTMKMNAANEEGINILGAAILRFTGIGKPGHTLETRQMTYITDSSERIFLSRDACIQLGMISESFPTVGEVHSNCTIQHDPGAKGHGINALCGCPARATPPPLPSKLPFPATDANRGKLETYLVEYYKSTCDHQMLPMMTGPPMRLMIEPDADPVAFHTPIPIPLHWQDEVKAGLDQDVRLGVFEPVPIGTPVTWCHRMVIIYVQRKLEN